MNGLRPLAYGFVRTDLVDDVPAWEQRIREFAAAQGFELAAVFRDATATLTQELLRAEAHAVIAPAPEHVAGLLSPAKIWTVES